MIQYLHSMEYRIETGGTNPSDAERVSQTVGADRNKNREWAWCLLCLVKNPGLKKQQKDWGEGSRLVLHPQELREHQRQHCHSLHGNSAF